jgi:hypothetical protein
VQGGEQNRDPFSPDDEHPLAWKEASRKLFAELLEGHLELSLNTLLWRPYGAGHLAYTREELGRMTWAQIDRAVDTLAHLREQEAKSFKRK